MDFSYSEEQTLLRNSLARYLADKYKFEAWRKFTAGETGRDPIHWAQFAELGLLAAPFAEAYGGLGGGAVDCAIVMEEFGKALVVEPYLPTVVIGGGFLRHGGSEAQKSEWLAKIAVGESLMAFAFAEPQGRFNLADLSTSATKKGGSFVLNGHKSVVIGAPWADQLIVTARTGGARRDEGGISVFLVDKSSKGISSRDFRTVDGRRAGEILFENVSVPAERLIGMPDNGLPLIARVVDEGIAALAAEATGCMKVLVDSTVEYSKTRKQFGTAIGKFQALQHRMVDMFIAYQQSVSITLMATLQLDGDETARARAASAAKVQIGNAARFIGQQAVQVHGGMGMTDELNIGHYFKRLAMIETMFGNTDHHMRRFASLAQDAA